mmetsp:Transcript_15208/g.49625  ORF Transcript_15208/g.49625 Transcript_15208/m.49625 type:complete len:243 (-) Transcript_15208:121-849(-)
MGPRSTSRSRTQSAGSGSARPSSATSTCRSASAWTTLPPMAPRLSPLCCTAPSLAPSSASSACSSSRPQATSPFGLRQPSCGCYRSRMTSCPTARPPSQSWPPPGFVPRWTREDGPSGSKSKSPTRTRSPSCLWWARPRSRRARSSSRCAREASWASSPSPRRWHCSRPPQTRRSSPSTSRPCKRHEHERGLGRAGLLAQHIPSNIQAPAAHYGGRDTTPNDKLTIAGSRAVATFHFHSPAC